MAKRRRARRKITVHFKKLGREKAFGLAWSNGYIEVDPRASSRSLLGTLLHEGLHVLFSGASESKVARSANSLCRLVWEAGYRRISK